MGGERIGKRSHLAAAAALVLLVLGLLGFPIGTLISAYGLWLVLSAKGRVVLSPEYAAIVAATVVAFGT